MPQDRLRKNTEDNRELAATLKRDAQPAQHTSRTLTKAGPTKKGRGQGSELGSGRGSEERHSSVPAGARGSKRSKDNDIEKVGPELSFPSDTPRGILHKYIKHPSRENPLQDTSSLSTWALSGYSPDFPIPSIETDDLPLPTRSLPQSITATSSSTTSPVPKMPPKQAPARVVGGRRISARPNKNKGQANRQSRRTSVGSEDADDFDDFDITGQNTRLSRRTGRSTTRRAPADVLEARPHKFGVRASRNTSSFQDEQMGNEEPESVDDILARTPPPDPEEHLSKATKRSGLFWAPLLSGTTNNEKMLIDQELRAEGRLEEIPPTFHPKYEKARIQDPSNMNRLHFFEGGDPQKRRMIAGVPESPLQIDPPGSGTPFDALKYPDRLVDMLNRLPNDPDNTLYGWDIQSLKRIPKHLFAKLKPAALTALPTEIQIRLPHEISEKAAPNTQSPPSLTVASEHADHKAKSRLTASSRQRSRGPGKPPHACLQCRQKRVKCDAVHPICGFCQSTNVECSFTEERDIPQETRADEEPVIQDDIPASIQEPLQVETARYTPLTVEYIQSFLEGSSDESSLDGAQPGPSQGAFPGAVTEQLGLSMKDIEPYLHYSGTDHLDPEANTNVPSSLLPKPTFSDTYGWSKPTKPRTPASQAKEKENADKQIFQEENFFSRPSVKISVPDHIKNILVDDWENVTKSLQLVPLPSQAPVNFILDSYFEEEKGKRRLGSPEADLLEEFVAGMKTYFAVSIGKTLLYKFERAQFIEVCCQLSSTLSLPRNIEVPNPLTQTNTDPPAVGEWQTSGMER